MCSYSGTDHSTGLKLAIKEIILEKTDNLQALQEEIGMAYNWQCPHIVRYLGSKVGVRTAVVRGVGLGVGEGSQICLDFRKSCDFPRRGEAHRHIDH